MKMIMVGCIFGTFLVNCYLLYLIHFRLRPILNSWAWWLIFTGFGCLFLMSALGVYLANQDPLPGTGKVVFCVLMLVKAIFFAVGLTVLYQDLKATLRSQVWLES